MHLSLPAPCHMLSRLYWGKSFHELRLCIIIPWRLPDQNYQHIAYFPTKRSKQQYLLVHSRCRTYFTSLVSIEHVLYFKRQSQSMTVLDLFEYLNINVPTSLSRIGLIGMESNFGLSKLPGNYQEKRKGFPSHDQNWNTRPS